MSRGPLLLLWSAATVLLAGGTAWWVAGQREHSLPPAVASSSEKSPVDFHTWMHGHLDLTPGQHEKMEAAEVQFERERARLQAEIRTCGKALADAIRSGPPESPEVQGPLTKLHAAQGELQQATLAHFYAMKQHLTPAQAEKLLQWTHDGITREPMD